MSKLDEYSHLVCETNKKRKKEKKKENAKLSCWMVEYVGYYWKQKQLFIFFTFIQFILLTCLLLKSNTRHHNEIGKWNIQKKKAGPFSNFPVFFFFFYFLVFQHRCCLVVPYKYVSGKLSVFEKFKVKGVKKLIVLDDDPQTFLTCKSVKYVWWLCSIL